MAKFKVFEVLFKNMQFKALSLFLACVLWFICINTVNPIVTKTFTGVLTVKNLDVVESNGYTLLNADELQALPVTIRVRAENDGFAQIQNGVLRPFIDASPINYLSEKNLLSPQPVSVYVDIPANSRFAPQFIETNPLTVNLLLDKIITAELPVTVNVQGAPAEGFVAISGQAAPGAVTVKGPSALINTITLVSVDAVVSKAEDTVFLEGAPIHITDGEKTDITDRLTLSQNTADVTVIIYQAAKIPVEQNTVNEPAAGFEVARVVRNAEFIEVYGSREDILNTKAIVLPDIDLEGQTEPFTVSYDARSYLLGTTLSVINGTPNEIETFIEIEEQIIKVVRLDAAQISVQNQPEGLVCKIADSECVFIVSGLKSKIIDFDAGDIMSAAVDASGFKPGVFAAPLVIKLPAGVHLSGDGPTVTAEVKAAERPQP